MKKIKNIILIVCCFMCLYGVVDYSPIEDDTMVIVPYSDGYGNQ